MGKAERRLFVGFFLLVGAVLGLGALASATTVLVDDDYPADDPAARQWMTVQAGIYDAAPGDTVYVYDGFYVENVTIWNASVTLEGQTRDGAIIDRMSGAAVPVIAVRADHVTIRNLTVKRGDYGIQSFTAAHHNGTVDNVTINSISYDCIEINSGSSWTIHDSSMASCGYGAIAIPTSSATSQHSIYNIDASTLTSYDGIYLYAVSYSTFQNITIQDPGRSGIYSYISYQNTFNGFRINSSGSYSIYLYNSDNSRFQNGSLTNKTGGAQAFYAYISDYLFLDNLTIANNAGGGVYLQASSFSMWRNVNNTNTAEPIEFYYQNPPPLSYYQHDIDTSNTLFGQPVVYFTNSTGGTYSGPAGWFGAVNSTGLNVTLNSSITGLIHGVLVFYTNGSTFTNFNSSGNGWNFVIQESNNNTFVNSTISSVRASGGSGGFYVAASSYNVFAGGIWQVPSRSWTAMNLLSNSNANNNTVVNVTCDNWNMCFDVDTNTADFRLDNVTVRGTNYGVYSYYATSLAIERSRFVSNWYYDVYVNSNAADVVASVAVRNSTFNNTIYYYAAYLGYINQGIIENNTFNNSDYGVYAYQTTNLLIQDNVFNYSRTCAIRGDYSNYLRLLNNTVLYGPCAIQWYYSSYWTLRSNNVTNMTRAFQHYVTAASQTSWYVHDMDTSNSLNGYPVLYIINTTAGAFSGAYSWLAVANSSNVTVSSTVNVTRNDAGLFAFQMNDSVVENTNFTANYWGITVFQSDRNTIRDVRIVQNTVGGAYVWRSDWNTFLRDYLRPDTAYGDYGFHFDETSNNDTIEQSDCSNFNTCVYLNTQTNSINVLNSTLNASYYGVYSYSRFGPRAEGNLFEWNYYYGIRVGYTSSPQSTGFRIANNTFNGSYYDSIYCYYCLGGSIEDNSMRSSDSALQLYQSEGVLIARNQIFQMASYGINSQYSDFDIAIDNTIRDGAAASSGFHLSYSRFWTLRGNNVTNQTRPVSWSFPVPMANFEYAMHDADPTNLANGNPWRWWVNASGVSFNGTAGLVILTNSTAMNVTVSNPVVRAHAGFAVVGTNGSTFYQSNLSQNEWGLVLYHSHNNTFLDLTVWRNTGGGAYISYSDWNRLLGGVYMPDAAYADAAVRFLAGSRNNTVSINETNFSSGVLIDYNAYDNRVDGGNYSFNYYGVQSNSYIGTRVERASFADNYYYHVYQYGGGSATNFNVISNNTMHRSSNYDGIYVYNVGGGLIADNLINATGSNGVYLQSVTGVTLARNLFTNGSGYAIEGYSSSSLFIVDNVVTRSRYGLYLYDSRYWTFVNNSLSNFTGTSPWSVYFNSPDPVTDATVFMHYWTPDNTIEGLPVRYYVNQTGVTFFGPAGWIVAVNSTFMDLGSSSLNTRNYIGALFVKVFNSTLRGYASNASYYGAALLWGADNRIENISVNASYRGIYLSNNTRATVNGAFVSNTTNIGLYPYLSTRLNVSNSTFYRGYQGVYVEYRSQYVNLTNNTFDGQSYIAIQTEAADDVRIVGNLILGAGYWSIYLSGSSGDHVDRDLIQGNRINSSGYDAFYAQYMYNSIIEGNNITNSGSAGLQLSFSNANQVRRNTFRYQYYGLFVTGASNTFIQNTVSNSTYLIYMPSGANFNQFYHNNFYLANGSIYDVGTSNTFDNGYPAGGNFWSNTTHTDLYRGAAQSTAGSDGINDTAANLQYGRRDNYPLSEPWPPYLTLVSPANGSVIQAGVTLDFNISAYFNTVQYSINNGTTTNLTTPFDVSTSGFADGDIFVRVWANDTWYNLTPTFLFTIDSTAPTISADGPAPGGTYLVGTQLNFTVTDAHLAANVTRNNGSGPVAFADPWDIDTTGWAEDDYNITIVAWDSAGNSRTSTFLFKLDSTAPTVSLVSPANGSFIAVGTVIDLSVADAHLSTVTWDNGGGPTSLGTPFDISTTGWSSATYNVTVIATDTGGLSTTRVYTFTIDATPPLITLVSPANNTVFEPGLTIDIAVADSNLVAVTWDDGSGAQAFASPYDLDTTGWADGAYDITVTANDTAGNIAVSRFHFEVDSLAPLVVVNSPTNNTFIAAGTPLDFSVSDPHLSAATWTSGSGDNPLSSPFDISTTGWADGTWVIRVNATDSLGHTSSANLTVRIDSVLPTVTLNSPANGSYIVAGATVDLTVADANLDVVNWTTGGAPLTLASPFDISTTGWADGVYTVRVNATDLAGNLRFASYTFTVDSTAPTVTLNSPSNGSFFPAGTTIDLAIVDANLNAADWTLDGAPTNFASPFDISTTGWADGPYTLRVNATDLAGNARFASFTFTVDSTPPSILLVSPTNGSYIVAGTAIDLGVTDTNLNAVDWTTSGAPAGLTSPFDISTTGWADGSYTVRVNATDLAGNLRFASFTFVVDSTAPSVTLASPANGSYFPAGTTIDLAVADANLNAADWTLGGAPTALSSPFDISTSGWSDGPYTVRVNATDLAGNRRFASFSFVVDSTPPTLTLTSPANGSYIVAGTTIDLVVSDTNLNLVNWTTGGAPTALLSPFDISTAGWADGSYTVRVNATDLAGNLRLASFTFVVDSTPPSVTLTSPANGSYFPAGTTIDLAVADANLNAADWTLGGAPTSLSSPFDISTTGWADGAYTVRVNATDLAGNRRFASFSFVVDSTPPTLTLTSPANGSYIVAGTTIDLAVADTNLNLVNWTTAGAPTGLLSPFDISTTGWADGSYNLRVNATDLAGNLRFASFLFVVDSTPPTFSLNSPASGSVVVAGTTLDLAVSDANLNTVTWTTGGAPTTLASPYDVSTSGWSDGLYTLRVNATDLAGNLRSANFTVTIDSTPPSVSLASPANGSAFRAGTTIDLVVSDTNLNFANWTTGGAPTAFTSPFDISTTGWADGNYTVRVNATDLAGNLRFASYAFVLDSTPPSVVLNSPLAGAVVRAGTTLDLGVADTNLRTVTWSDGSTTTPLASPFDISTAAWADGAFSVSVFADDAAGNAAWLNFTVTIDSTGPSIALVAPANGSVVRAGTVLGWNISDANLLNASYNNGTADLALASPFQVSTAGYIDRNYNFTLFARDAAGNSASARFNFTIDSTPPQLLLLSPTNGSWVREGVTIDFGISDLHLSFLEVRLDGALIALDPGFDYASNNLPDGNHTFWIVAADEAGNSRSLNASFMVDKTAPLLSWTPADGSIVRMGTGWSVGITEPNLRIAQWRNESDIGWTDLPASHIIDTSGWPDGFVRVFVQVDDFASHLVVQNSSLTIDSTPPSIEGYLAQIQPGYWQPGRPIDILITNETSPYVIEVYVRGSLVALTSTGPDAFTLDVSLEAEGQADIDIRVTDEAGNSAQVTVVLLFDGTAPALASPLPMAYGGNEDSPFGFHASAIDAIALASELSYVWAFNDSRVLSEVILAGSDATWTFTTPGLYGVNVSVSDPAGNLNNTTITITIFDITPPSLTLPVTYINTTEDMPVAITQSSLDNSNGTLNWTWRAPGANLTSYGPNITWVFQTPGLYNISVTVTDPQNNSARGYVMVNVSDITPPDASIVGPSVVDVFIPAVFSANVTDNDPRFGPLNWTFQWLYDNGTEQRLRTGQSASFIDTEAGSATVRLTVTDAAGNVRVVNHILIVNAPPTIDSQPPTEVDANGSWVWQVNATDPEGNATNITLVNGPPGMVVNPDGTITWTPPPGEGGTNQTITVAISDGLSTVYRNFTLFVIDPAVLAGNHRPVFETEPPTDARVSTAYLYDIVVRDDDGDPIQLSFTGLDGYAFNPATGRLSWMPPWRPDVNERFERAVPVVITAFDGKQTAKQEFVIRFRNPPNIWPELVGFFSIGDVFVDQTLRIHLAQNWTDRDDLLMNLTFVVNSTDAQLRARVGQILRWHVDTSDAFNPVLIIEVIGEGSAQFNMSARDPSGGKSDSSFVTVNARTALTAPPPAAAFPWWMLLILAAGGAAGAAGLVVSLRRSRAASQVAQTALETAAKAPTERITERVIIQQGPGAAVPEARKDTYVIEGVFIIYGDGRLVYSKTDISEVKFEDPELVASMFSAVQSFIKDSFQQEGELNRLGMGENAIMIERGTSIYMAAIIFGEPQADLTDAMRETIRTIENAYAGIIEEWDGSTTSLEAIDQYVEPFLALTATRTRADAKQAMTEKVVKMPSELEFFQGFVRLKCGVKNDTDTVITKVTVSIDFNEDVLRLHHIEPDSYKYQGSEVQLGVLNPGEKVSVAYYFDPQICTESQIDGVGRYRDAKGGVHSIAMKTRKAEVVCPIFFTKEHANTAMLKRLVESELKDMDSKVYNITAIPEGMKWSDIFGLVKEVVLGHDVHLVRDFIVEEPYHGEAWFYGETKVKGYKIVIRASVIEDGQKIEFFAASTQIRAITGLLAEFNHTLQSLIGRKYATLKVEAEFNEEVKQDIQKKSLMAKLGEGELEGGETEQDG